MSKPSIPQGTRDFSPDVVAKRNYIFDAIRKVFMCYGFQPIETPTLENLSTLTGKYGEEGDRLLFKVLNNGDYLSKVDDQLLADKNSQKLISAICDRGLRYDLTVPFARYVVMHQNEISFPFKRYQIQPVWRADRPQRGRYREFYQCDADVVGSPSLVYEAELAQIYDQVFADLGLKVVIKINNRKVLQGMAEAAGITDRFMDMTVAIDKLDKIGMDGVRKELEERGIEASSIDVIEQILKVKSLSELKPFMKESPIGLKGIEELKQFHSYFDLKAISNELRFDVTLARGLNYYTGCIFEVQAVDVKMGSIGGGGRYDDLTGVFGLKNVSGVGISFGADRIYDCLEELNLFPENTTQMLKVLFVSFDDATHHYAFQCLIEFRKAGISSDIYPEPVKLQKQMKYANDRNVPYTILIGEEEMMTGQLTLKNMVSGEQQKMGLDEVIQVLIK
jgi:histidyl-tRNA synthetase